MADWKRKSIAGGPSPATGDWKRRSIAGGPSPEMPNEIVPGALPLNLDFFYHPRVAFPCNRADQNGGHRRMAVTPPARMAPPSQAQQCQPAGTAPTGGSGSRPGGSRLRIKVPSASQLPPLPEDVADLFDNVEFYSEEEEAMLSGRSEEEEEDGEDMSSGRSEEDEDGEDMSSGRSEEEGGDGEDMSSGYSEEEEDGEDMSSGRSEEEEDREAMSSGRSEGEEAGQQEMEEEAGQDEMEEEAGEEEAMLSGGVDVDAMLYCHEGEEAFLSQSEEEEEPEEVHAMCVHCESLERLVTLLPCRHASYCERCFAIFDRLNTPARPELCRVCWRPYTRGHPQSGGLQPKPKKSSK